jgi:hypothetical protein
MAKAKTTKGNTFTIKTLKGEIVSEKGVVILGKVGNPRIYTRKLGSRVAVFAKPVNTGKFHIIMGTAERWAVVADGKTKATKVFETKLGAIEFATEIATEIEGEVIIHKESGQIENRVSLAK